MMSLRISETVLKSYPILDRQFYSEHTVDVAQALLGKILITRKLSSTKNGEPSVLKTTAGRILETEAYRGDDPASHSARGETPRCSIMFGEPGVAYVYFIYGMYEMLNFVTEPKGHPGAVLIRSLQPLYGIETMIERRERFGRSWSQKSRLTQPSQLTHGPGRLCQAMGIEMSDNGQSLQGPSLVVCEDGYPVSKIQKSPRIGISAGQDRLWRFFIS